MGTGPYSFNQENYQDSPTVTLNRASYNGDLGELITSHQLLLDLSLPDMSAADFLIAIKVRSSLNFAYNANTRVAVLASLKRSYRTSRRSINRTGLPAIPNLLLI